jgi:hypothetical protein
MREVRRKEMSDVEEVSVSVEVHELQKLKGSLDFDVVGRQKSAESGFFFSASPALFHLPSIDIIQRCSYESQWFA